MPLASWYSTFLHWYHFSAFATEQTQVMYKPRSSAVHVSSKLIQHFHALILFLCFFHWTDTCINQAVVHFPQLRIAALLLSLPFLSKTWGRTCRRKADVFAGGHSQKLSHSYWLLFRSQTGLQVLAMYHHTSISTWCLKIAVRCYYDAIQLQSDNTSLPDFTPMLLHIPVTHQCSTLHTAHVGMP